MNHLLNQHPFIKQAIKDIKSSIAISPNYFFKLYQPVINSALDLFSESSNPTEPSKALKKAFVHAIACLQLRRGMMLPLYSDTETCYTEQEAWSYALFICALFKDKLPDERLVTESVTILGQTWLQSYPELHQQFLLYCKALDANNNLIALTIQSAVFKLKSNQ